jgi:hypothetical protein
LVGGFCFRFDKYFVFSANVNGLAGLGNGKSVSDGVWSVSEE